MLVALIQHTVWPHLSSPGSSGRGFMELSRSVGVPMSAWVGSGSSGWRTLGPGRRTVTPRASRAASDTSASADRRARESPTTDGYSVLMGATRVSRHIRAPRSLVYRALLDGEAVQQWMVPDGMTSRVHWFDARERGAFRISLTYDLPSVGKTSPQADSFSGSFVKLVPDSEVVQVVEFDTEDPSMQGEMTITYVLVDADDGTDLIGLHENLPPGVWPADNELGWRMSIDKLSPSRGSSSAPGRRDVRRRRLGPRAITVGRVPSGLGRYRACADRSGELHRPVSWKAGLPAARTFRRRRNPSAGTRDIQPRSLGESSGVQPRRAPSEITAHVAASP